MIHEHGITPNIVVPITEEEEMAIQLRRIPGGRTNLDDALQNYPASQRGRLRDLVISDADPQLERAMDLLKAVRLMSKRNDEKSSRKAQAADTVR